MNRKIIITIFVVILLVGVAMYYATMQKEQDAQGSTQEDSTQETVLDGKDSLIPPLESANFDKGNISDWETYRSEEIGFEFRYPSDLTVDFNTKTVLRVYDASYDSAGKVGAEVRKEYREVEFDIKPFSQDLFDEEQAILDEELKNTKENIRNLVSKNILRVSGGDGFLYRMWSGLIGNYSQALFHNRQYIFITSPTYNDFIVEILSTFKFNP